MSDITCKNHTKFQKSHSKNICVTITSLETIHEQIKKDMLGYSILITNS